LHSEGDQFGWLTFQKKYGIDLVAEADRLAAASPYIKKTTDV
jgi:hypothetical protein